MSLRGSYVRAKNWVAGKAASISQRIRKSLSFGMYESGGGLGREYSSGANARNAGQWLEAYCGNSRLRGPIDRRAQDVAALKLHLFRRSESGEELERTEIRKHEILTLMRRPNPSHTWAQWCKLAFIYLETAGRFPCYIERRPDGLPKHYWPIVPKDVKRKPSVRRQTWAFILHGNKMTCPVQDMLWITYPDPTDPYGWGLGRAPAVADEVAQDSYASLWNSNFFRQGAHLGKIISVPGLDDKSGPKIRADFESKHGGINNSHRPFFVGTNGGAVSFVDLTPSHKDLDFVEGKKHLRDTIAQNWGVPPELLGILENSNRATIDAAVNIHQRMNVAADARFFEEQLNIHVVAEWGDPDLYLEFENPVQETQQFKLDQATKGLVSGAITVNEWRVANAMEPKPGWDVFLVPVNLTVQKEDGDPAMPRPQLATPAPDRQPERAPDEYAVDPEKSLGTYDDNDFDSIAENFIRQFNFVKVPA